MSWLRRPHAPGEAASRRGQQTQFLDRGQRRDVSNYSSKELRPPPPTNVPVPTLFKPDTGGSEDCPALENAIDTLATELWDRCFSVAEIRAALEKAAAGLPRHAAGHDVHP